MVPPTSVLVALLMLIDRIPVPPEPARRGRPKIYSDRLSLKALVIMIVRRLPQVHRLLAVLAEPSPEMQRVRAVLRENGCYPSRRPFERRLRAIPASRPAQIGCLGRLLVAQIQPWAEQGPAAALASTPLRALGGVGHPKHREQGLVPHPSVDPEAHGTKSGWHGWVDGGKLHLAMTVAAVGIPLAAELTPANTADNIQAQTLLPELPAEVHLVLGDGHDNDPELRAACEADGRLLVTSQRGHSPPTDPGVAVRRIFHELRSRANENFTGLFKDIFGCRGQVPTKGPIATRRYALGAVFVYQLALLQRFEAGADLRVGLKASLQAA